MQDYYPKEQEARKYGLKVRVIYIEEFEAPSEGITEEILQYFQGINFKDEVIFQIQNLTMLERNPCQRRTVLEENPL